MPASLLLRTTTEAGLTALRAAALKKQREQSVYARFQQRYFADPVAFAKDCIDWPKGESLAPHQAEILQAMIDHGRASYRGPHGIGKTTVKAISVLWFALTRDGKDWKIPTTASVWQQLTRYLWPEIHKWARLLKWDVIGRQPFKQGQEILALALKLQTGEAFAIASSDSERIEGAHADHLLYIFDEAKIIPDKTFDSAEGAFSSAVKERGREAYALAGSTPGEPSGRFYNIHRKAPGLEHWWTRHVTLEEAIATGRVDAAWAERQRYLWGERSALYQNRVLGQFCASDEDGVIPLSWVEAAVQRWRDFIDSGAPLPPFTCIGVDVANGGNAKNVFAPRYENIIPELIHFRSSRVHDVMELTGFIGQYLADHGGYAVVDGIGVGAGVVARASERSYNVVPFIASGKSVARDKSGQLRMANQRSEAWWRMRELLSPDSGEAITLPDDDLLLGDLTTPHWRMMSNGRVLIEAKEEIAKRIGRSTDDGDAVVMSYYVQNPDLTSAYGMIKCTTCGEDYHPDPSGKPRPCPYCSGQSRRWRPAPYQEVA